MSYLTVAAYLFIAGVSGVWFWRLVKQAPAARVSRVLVSTVFGLVWPTTMPGIVMYRLLWKELADGG